MKGVVVSVKNMTRFRLPRFAWTKIKNKILSPRYNLSLVFVGSSKMTELNRRYRKKSGSTNVLAFPLEKLSGEILIDLSVARREAKSRGVSTKRHVLYLFIHAMLHLKGFRHNHVRSRVHMENLEQKWLEILQ